MRSNLRAPTLFLLLIASAMVLLSWVSAPAIGSVGPAQVTIPGPVTSYTSTTVVSSPTVTLSSTQTIYTTTSTSTSTSTSTTSSQSSSFTTTESQTLTSTTTSTSYTGTVSTGVTSVSTTSSTTTQTSTSTSSSTSTTTIAKLPSCLIATASFGSALAPEVQLLRDFRDNQILRTSAGSSFMIVFNAWYYSFSPAVASQISTSSTEMMVMRGVLYPLIGILKLSSLTFSAASGVPELAAFLSGMVASSLIGAFYLGLPMSLVRTKISRLRGSKYQKTVERALLVILLGGIATLLVGELLASSSLLMISSVTVLLSMLFLSATFTSGRISKKLQSL